MNDDDDMELNYLDYQINYIFVFVNILDLD